MMFFMVTSSLLMHILVSIITCLFLPNLMVLNYFYLQLYPCFLRSQKVLIKI